MIPSLEQHSQCYYQLATSSLASRRMVVLWWANLWAHQSSFHWKLEEDYYYIAKIGSLSLSLSVGSGRGVSTPNWLTFSSSFWSSLHSTCPKPGGLSTVLSSIKDCFFFCSISRLASTSGSGTSLLLIIRYIDRQREKEILIQELIFF